MTEHTAINRRNLLQAIGITAGIAISPSCQRALESGVDLTAPPMNGNLSEDQLQVIASLAERSTVRRRTASTSGSWSARD